MATQNPFGAIQPIDDDEDAKMPETSPKPEPTVVEQKPTQPSLRKSLDADIVEPHPSRPFQYSRGWLLKMHKPDYPLPVDFVFTPQVTTQESLVPVAFAPHDDQVRRRREFCRIFSLAKEVECEDPPSILSCKLELFRNKFKMMFAYSLGNISWFPLLLLSLAQSFCLYFPPSHLLLDPRYIG
jgi:hypothetical protein